jgi:hypothetical protein
VSNVKRGKHPEICSLWRNVCDQVGFVLMACNCRPQSSSCFSEISFASACVGQCFQQSHFATCGKLFHEITFIPGIRVKAGYYKKGRGLLAETARRVLCTNEPRPLLVRFGCCVANACRVVVSFPFSTPFDE